MAMRAGSYNAAPPQWRAVIRDGSYPQYVCVHTDHACQPEATACAKAGLAAIRAAQGTLPRGWIPYRPTPRA